MPRIVAALAPVFALAFTFTGCSSGQPKRVMPPGINPQEAAQAALAQYDTNGDGLLDAQELKKSPALASALKRIDKNGDDKISATEIAERIQQWQASKVAVMPFSCRVTLDKSPLVGATVKLVPEKFLGPNVQPAEGKTNEQGMAMLTVAKDKLPNPNISGCHVGLYSVEISKEGGKAVPERYNTQTELGEEVAIDNPELITGVTFDLKSR